MPSINLIWAAQVIARISQRSELTEWPVADEDQHTSDWSARPLPGCLTRLLIDPNNRIKPADGPLAGSPKPTLLNRVLWWFSVTMFVAAAFIFSVTFTVRLLH